MFHSLWVAKTGMEAQDFRVQTIANNMANASTNAFKKDLAHFSSLDYSIVRGSEGQDENGVVGGSALQVGHGVTVSSVSKIHTQGEIKVTDDPTDLYINGEGFLPLWDPRLNGGTGGVVFTRDGNFDMVEDSATPGTYNLVHVASGLKLYGETAAKATPDTTAPTGPIALTTTQASISPGINTIVIDRNGEIFEQVNDGQNSLNQFIVTAKFGAKSGLTPASGNTFQDDEARTGGALYGEPDSPGFGNLRQNALEVSNVTVIDEMVDMIEAQRGYEMGSKMLEKADEMISTLIQRT